jgi:hypothetical protein
MAPRRLTLWVRDKDLPVIAVLFDKQDEPPNVLSITDDAHSTLFRPIVQI